MLEDARADVEEQQEAAAAERRVAPTAEAATRGADAIIR
jgi:hypothetical protein